MHSPAETIVAVLADPASHAPIDGTGWVRETLDTKPLTPPAGFPDPGVIQQRLYWTVQRPN